MDQEERIQNKFCSLFNDTERLEKITLEKVKKYVEMKIDPNVKDNKKNTPLVNLSINYNVVSDRKLVIDLIYYLIQNKADPNLVSSLNKQIPLQLFCREEAKG